MADWHCKQIPNGQQPIVVCERETLTAEIERLWAAGDALAEALHGWCDGMDAFEEDQDRVRAWHEARRG